MNIHITIVPHSLSNIKHIKVNVVILILILVLVVLPVIFYKGCNQYKATDEVIALRKEVDSLVPTLEKIKTDYNFVERMVEENERKIHDILKISNYQAKIFYDVPILSYRDPDILLEDIALQKKRQDKIIREIKSDREVLLYIPSIAPTRGRVIRNFGYTSDPFTGEIRFCQGIDILAETGAEVYAAANGTVSFAGWKRHEGYTVEITHKRDIVTRYSHLSVIKTKKGRKVKRRDVIGLVGKTGKTEGPRLHYEVWKDSKPVNPFSYILESIEVI